VVGSLPPVHSIKGQRPAAYAPLGNTFPNYLTAPAARGVVARCAAALSGDAPARLTVWDLPPTALTPGT
jgi:hypothetical protein